MQLKLLVLLLYLLSISNNETAAEGDNNNSITKYIHRIDLEGVDFDVEANNFYEKISIIGLMTAG